MVGGGSKGGLPGYSGRDSICRGDRGGRDGMSQSYVDSSVASRRSNLSNSFMQRMSRNGLGDGGRYARDGGGGGGRGEGGEGAVGGGGGRDRVGGGPPHCMNGWGDDEDSGSGCREGYVVQVHNGRDDGYDFGSKRSYSSSRGGERGKDSDLSVGARKKGRVTDGESSPHGHGISAMTMDSHLESGDDENLGRLSPNLLRSAK